VGTVLEGTVRRAGNRLRVTAQLVNVADGYHLWSQRFDRQMQDVFDLQDELARAIVQVLRVRLAGKEEQRLVKPFTGTLEVYELCLKGRYYLWKYSREGLKKSIECYDQARQEDPGCAAAYAGLAAARCFSTVVGWVPPREAMPQARTEALRALEIDDTTASAHTCLALIRHWYEWDWKGAEAEYKRALELNPADTDAWVRYAEFCAYMGRREESINLATRAVKLEPVSVETNVYLALILTFARRYEEAIAQCRKTLELDPNHYVSLVWLGLAYAGLGKYREAVEACEQGHALAPGYPMPTGFLAWVCALAGRTAEARAVLAGLLRRRTEAYFSPTILAWIYAGLGEADEAFHWLDTAYEERDGLLVVVKAVLFFDPLRMDPRFQELLRKMRLED
jgi:serine/threonine-protein kinase